MIWRKTRRPVELQLTTRTFWSNDFVVDLWPLPRLRRRWRHRWQSLLTLLNGTRQWIISRFIVLVSRCSKAPTFFRSFFVVNNKRKIQANIGVTQRIKGNDTSDKIRNEPWCTASSSTMAAYKVEASVNTYNCCSRCYRKEPDLELEGLIKRHFTQVEFLQGTVMDANDLHRTCVRTQSAWLLLSYLCLTCII